MDRVFITETAAPIYTPLALDHGKRPCVEVIALNAHGASAPQLAIAADVVRDPIWVFGASSWRMQPGVNALASYAPASTRLVDVSDSYLPARPAGWRVVLVNFGLYSDAGNSDGSPYPRETLPGTSTNTINYLVAFTGKDGTGTRT